MISAMIGRMHHVVVDCPEPATLARFYSELLGQPVTYPGKPQQFHLDVMVDDLDEAAARVLEIGARRLADGRHVYADPAGHPFCLIPRPSWAPPVHRRT